MTRATLTFDNGPTPGVTEQVLDTLAERGAKATFFVVANDLEQPQARALVEREVAEGHWVGNHTLTHAVQLGEADAETTRREIEDAQASLGALAHADRLFRPYGGGGILNEQLLSDEAVEILERGGYTCVLWNSVPRDWEDPQGWVERAVDDVMTRGWSVVVLHDTPTGAMDALPRFLDALAEAGVELVQEFPDDCVPVRRGVADRASLHHLMS